MSSHLRRALSYTAELAEGPAYGHAKSLFHGGSTFIAPNRTLEAAQTPRVAGSARPMRALAAPGGRVRALPSTEPDHAPRRRVEESELAVGSSSIRVAETDSFASIHSALRSPDTAPNLEPLAQQSEQASTLAPLLLAKLQEYWRLTRVEHVRRALTPAQHAVSSMQAPTAWMVDELPAAKSSQREERQTPSSMAQSLHQFVTSMGGQVAPLTSRTSPFEPAPSLPAREAALLERGHAATAAVESSWDLADSIAGILHEQALQHGIDLT